MKDALKERQLNRALVDFAKESRRIAKLSDAELVDAVINHIWTNVPMSRSSEIILHELLSRFETKCGLTHYEDVQ